MRNQPKAILFDHDGVLVASEPLHCKAWGAVMNELELVSDEKWIQNQAGKTAPLILSKMIEDYSLTVSEERYSELIQHKHRFYNSLIEKELTPYPGVKEGLKWLKTQGIQAAVVSNARSYDLKRALDVLGLSHFFKIVLSRENVLTPKPHPALYQLAVQSLGLELDECLALEDSPPGLSAALLARIPSAAVLTNFERTELLQPVEGQPELCPIWIGASPEIFFEWLKQRTLQ